MKNFYETNCSDFDTFLKHQQNKERRHKKNEYKKLKSNIYFVTAIILILAILLTTSVVVASALVIKNGLLNDELSLQAESYREAVDYYESLNAYTADNAVNDFISELTNDVLSVNPNDLTKSKLKSFITEVENYIINFEALGLSETHPDIHQELKDKLDSAVYALDNDTYLYPYSDKDYVLMCNLVMREQGDNVSPDESQCLVACVALNRKAQGPLYAKDAKDPNNPTLLEVITQKNQYGPNYSYNMNLNGITDKVQENVRKVFEHEYEAPYNVLFQTMKYYPEKTIFKKIWNPAPYNSYTYFYYGNTVN